MSREFEQHLDLKPILQDCGANFAENLTHYVLKVCPFCSGKGKFFIDKKSKKWVCFRCVKTDDFSNKQGRGNLYTLFRDALKLSGIEIRNIVKNGEVMHYTDPDMMPRAKNEEELGLKQIILPQSFIQLDGSVESIRTYKNAYSYLFSRKVNDIQRIRKFDLRYDTQYQRIVFPIYLDKYTIVGWQGRDITERWKKDHPKCSNGDCELRSKYYFVGEEIAPSRCPSCYSELEISNYPKSRNSTNFPKSNLFFNQHSVDWEKTVTIVEGPFDCINTPNSIAFLGKSLSNIQLNYLIKTAKSLIIYLDGDEAGLFSTASLARSLGPFFSDLRVCPAVSGLDPGSFSIAENRDHLLKSINYSEWLRENPLI